MVVEASTNFREAEETTATESPRWLDETQMQAWKGLLAIVHRAFPELERGFKEHGILAVHYQIFNELAAAPDKTLRLSELSERANLSRSRLTHRLRMLIDDGYVEIADDPNDNRAKRATLTPKGEARLSEIAPSHVELVQRLIFDSLNKTQTEALAEGLAVVEDSLCCHPEYLNPRDCSKDRAES